MKTVCGWHMKPTPCPVNDSQCRLTTDKVTVETVRQLHNGKNLGEESR